MFITNIKECIDKKWMYAIIKDNNDKLLCSATLGFILQEYYGQRNMVYNYKEALMKYIKHNEK